MSFQKTKGFTSWTGQGLGCKTLSKALASCNTWAIDGAGSACFVSDMSTPCVHKDSAGYRIASEAGFREIVVKLTA